MISSRVLSISALLLAALVQPSAAQPPSDRPNFVVILTDDQRFDTLWAMPIVQQELVSRGVIFHQALVSTPLCCPFRAGFLAGGFLAHDTGVLYNEAPNGGAARFDDGDTLATRLQDAGYATALVGKYMNGYQAIAPRIPPGWSLWYGAINTTLPTTGWTVVVSGASGAQPTSGQFVSLAGSPYPPYDLQDRALDFIDAHASDPFFLLWSVDAPHVPATPAPGDGNLFSDYLYRGRGWGEADLSDKPTRVQIVAAQYPAIAAAEDEYHRNALRSLQAVDRGVGAIVDRLAQHGILDRTVLVFTSDNGYLWGEHGFTYKLEIYEEAIRVPLIVVVPGMQPRPDTKHQIVVDLDVPATVLDLAGVDAPTEGLSLVPLLESSQAAWRTSAPIEAWTPHQSFSGLRVFDARGRWKYVEHTPGYAELYDLLNDPYELENRAEDPAYQSIRTQLAAELGPQKGLASTTHWAPTARVGLPYRYALGAWGGRPPYTWSVEGTLPPGFWLDESGLLGGIPGRRGTDTVTFVVRDTSSDTRSGTPQTYRQVLQLRVTADCSDGLDNDGDGLIDAGSDPGCRDADFHPEDPACQDGLDNDGDGGIDFDGGASRNGGVPLAQADTRCTAAWVAAEMRLGCGLGAEILPLGAWLAARRRRAV